jgi:hypothetical protein
MGRTRVVPVPCVIASYTNDLSVIVRSAGAASQVVTVRFLRAILTAQTFGLVPVVRPVVSFEGIGKSAPA